MSELSEDQSSVAGMDISPVSPWKKDKPTVASDDEEVADALGNLSISAIKKLQVCTCGGVHAVVCVRLSKVCVCAG